MMKFYAKICAFILVTTLILSVGLSVQAQAILYNDLNEPENAVNDFNERLKAQQNPLWIQQNRIKELREDIINQLDTVIVNGVSSPTQRQTHTYSAEGNRIYTLIEHLNNNVWGFHKQENATFDDEDNKLTSIIENFVDGSWENDKKTTRTFTSNHNILTQVTSYWVGNGWLDDSKWTYVYNTAGNPVSILSEEWNNGDWINNTFKLFTYDQNDNLVSSTSETWINSTWINSYRDVYTYDANGNMLSQITENWISDDWQNVYKDNYAYNMSNMPSNYAGQFWDISLASWVNDIQFRYEYNELDYLINSEQKQWVDGGWLEFEMNDYTYATFGSLESTLLGSWNESSGTYENNALTQSNYDEYGNATNVYFYNWSGNSWVLNEDGVLPLTYNFNTKEEAFIGSYLYAHFASLPVGINDYVTANKAELLCQPNPSNGETTIMINIPYETMATVTIYSLTGNKVKTIAESLFNKGNHQISLTTNEYHPGLYFLLLETVENNFTYKLIIN